MAEKSDKSLIKQADKMTESSPGSRPQGGKEAGSNIPEGRTVSDPKLTGQDVRQANEMTQQRGADMGGREAGLPQEGTARGGTAAAAVGQAQGPQTQGAAATAAGATTPGQNPVAPGTELPAGVTRPVAGSGPAGVPAATTAGVGFGLATASAQPAPEGTPRPWPRIRLATGEDVPAPVPEGVEGPKEGEQILILSGGERLLARVAAVHGDANGEIDAEVYSPQYRRFERVPAASGGLADASQPIGAERWEMVPGSREYPRPQGQ